MFALRPLRRRHGRRDCSDRTAFADRVTSADQVAFADQVKSELTDELPDEDLGQDLEDCLAVYELGSKPRCEEVEYLELVQEAIDRIDRGR
ncbi:hypothetical protein WEB32_14950 [Streptomyces netropsis]|uniref:Uncharacterized protein n=1 Tax=Streptomyces netropsis TaxID=55404 RepID=A0A7W7PF34_STRNE|nr:hypothetical protein [Streptomyces netropsis]MBB4886863.1 hypothetical protein [Streptomyces netropsis]GGR23721.1 hypothetical protein GCM10010219_30580 [Streptomyces netropsis]